MFLIAGKFCGSAMNFFRGYLLVTAKVKYEKIFDRYMLPESKLFFVNAQKLNLYFTYKVPQKFIALISTSI